jgi:hypothetical protein
MSAPTDPKSMIIFVDHLAWWIGAAEYRRKLLEMASFQPMTGPTPRDLLKCRVGN